MSNDVFDFNGERAQRGLPPVLRSGGGGGTSDSMDGRVSKLETHMEYMREKVDALPTKADLAAALEGLPTKADLWSWKIQYTALCVGAIALIVGGIIGGLAWIQDQAPPAAAAAATPAPQPIIIQVPAPAAAPVTPR